MCALYTSISVGQYLPRGTKPLPGFFTCVSEAPWHKKFMLHNAVAVPRCDSLVSRVMD